MDNRKYYQIRVITSDGEIRNFHFLAFNFNEAIKRSRFACLIEQDSFLDFLGRYSWVKNEYYKLNNQISMQKLMPIFYEVSLKIFSSERADVQSVTVHLIWRGLDKAFKDKLKRKRK